MGDGLLSWVDIVLGCVLLSSVLLGLWRGLLYEVLSLAGWVAAYFGAAPLAPWVAQWLPAQRMSPALLNGVSLVVAFVAILIVWGLAARLLRALLRATPLSVLDRIGGAGFGALRGLLLCLLMVMAASLSPLAKSPSWQASRAVPTLGAVLQWLKPALPQALVKYIPA